MTQPNIPRLQHLIKILQAVPEKHFDLCYWFHGTKQDVAILHCGTSACAMGWAALDPKFQEQGLKIASWGTPAFEDVIGYSAAARFFNIPYERAFWLFHPNEYHFSSHTNPQAVITRINQLIEESAP